MKRMEVKTFWLILVGLVVTYVARIIDTFRPVSLDTESLITTGLSQDQIDQVIEFSKTINLVMLFVFGGLLAYFIYLLVQNKNKETKQGYIGLLYVLYIILLIFNAIALLTGNFLAVVGLTGNILIVVGANKQKKYTYRIYDDEDTYLEK